MKIVVVGGSGLIASKRVSMLTRDDDQVVAASRRSGVDHPLDMVCKARDDVD